MASIGQRIRFLFTGKTKAETQLRPQSRVDAAQTDNYNKNHWSNTDAFSADAAFDPGTRFKLRNRARYESVNNCYAKRAMRTGADDLIGTGPRLQITLPNDQDGELARQIEASWQAWADETKLAIKLRTAHKSYIRDGECFGLFDTNERLRHPVKFDTRWLEADQCTTPFEMVQDPMVTDGVRFDRMQNPVEYFFLVNHPGATVLQTMMPTKFYTKRAEEVVHWYCMDRFGQHRAIPELTPALPLYAQLRRYTLATMTAAEFAASIAGVMNTKAPPESGASVTGASDWDMWELVRGALLTLPDGWEAKQFNATQPTTTYPDFKREILGEAGSSMCLPLGVATGNSSGYNYSSGRLDHVPYQRSHRIIRNDLRLMGLDPILRDGWYPEAALVGAIPSEAPPISQWRWSWNWDGFDSIDPYKDAQTDDLRLSNCTATHAEIYAEHNEDWEEKFHQIAKEKALLESLGLPWPCGSMTVVSGEKKAAPTSQADAVAMAMREFGIKEHVIAETIELLRPSLNGAY